MTKTRPGGYEGRKDGVVEHKKDTVTMDYTTEEQKNTIILLFGEKENGNYHLITDDYLESDDLDKGIILQYKPIKTEKALLVHCIDPS